MTGQTKASRLEARITPDVHALLKRAAEIEGRSLTDFVVTAASQAAQRTIDQAEVLRLSLAQAETVAALVADPPTPNAAMRAAKARHKALIAEE